MRLMLIGIGSSFGDDDLGWEGARFVASELTDHRIVETELHVTQNPAAEVPALLASAGNALLVDAVEPDIPLTASVRVTLSMMADWQATSSHGIGLGTTMQLLDALDALPQHWAVIGIPAGLAGTPQVWQSQVRRLLTDVLGEWSRSEK